MNEAQRYNKALEQRHVRIGDYELFRNWGLVNLTLGALLYVTGFYLISDFEWIATKGLGCSLIIMSLCFAAGAGNQFRLSREARKNRE